MKFNSSYVCLNFVYIIKETPPLKLSGEVVNTPPPESTEQQRIRLDHFRNPWIRDLAGNASRLQRPERASQPEQPRPVVGRLSKSRTAVFTERPPSHSPPNVVKLADFVPPATNKDRFYHPYSPRPTRPRQRSITPPGYPESEVDNYVPRLEDCTVRSEVSECEYQPQKEPPVEKEQEAPVRNWRVRNTKTNTVRYIDSNDLLQPESSLENNFS